MTGMYSEIIPLRNQPVSPQTPLINPRGVAIVDIQADKIVCVAATGSDQVTALQLTSSGQLQPFPIGAFNEMPTAANVRTPQVVEIGGTPYMVVGREEVVLTLRIEAKGALTFVSNLSDTALLRLGGHRGPIASIETGGDTYVYVPAQLENGLTAIRLSNVGQLSVVETESDADNVLNALDGVFQLHAATSPFGAGIIIDPWNRRPINRRKFHARPVQLRLRDPLDLRNVPVDYGRAIVDVNFDCISRLNVAIHASRLSWGGWT